MWCNTRMFKEYSCPQCQGAARLFDPGTLAPHQFFSPANNYMIAAGDSRQRLPIYICTTCGHGFTPLDVDPATIVTWYQNNLPDQAYLTDEPARRRTARAVLRRLESLMAGQTGRLLDVGAGPGIFVSQASRHGWNATGLEPSTWAVRHGRRVYKADMIQGDFGQLATLPTQAYDVVTMFDVIEHVAEPHTLAAAAAQRLRPGGLLVLTTPRFDSLLARVMGRQWYCIFPAHIHYFTKHSLQSLLEATGFERMRYRTHTRYVSAHYFWQRLKTFFLSSPMTPGLNSRPSTSIPINFRDEFELYARKRRR